MNEQQNALFWQGSSRRQNNVNRFDTFSEKYTLDVHADCSYKTSKVITMTEIATVLLIDC